MHRPVVRLLAGAFGGLVATLPMSVVMLGWHRRLPWLQQHPLPPAHITASALRTVGLHDDFSAEQQQSLTVVNHFGYGASMGAVYGLLAPSRGVPSAVTTGVAYGLSVWGASYLGWLPATGLYRSAADEPRERNLLMVAAHVVWGGCLGLVTELALRRLAEKDDNTQAKPHEDQPAEPGMERTGV
jgi:uncharacterized membrane protein YagU involved in acid resistance